MKRVLLVVLVVVLAGCSGIVPGDAGDDGPPAHLGEVGNVSYDDDLDVDPADGFTETELQQFVNRSMARVEVIRGLQFKRGVDVEILTREEYGEERARRSTSQTRSEWNNQIWQSLFIVGQDRDVTQELEEAYGQAVQGYYQPGEDSIVIVSDADQPTIRTKTLVHELVHALQDQHYGLEFGQGTRDEQAAYDTLVEGEAELVPALYQDRCEEWACVEQAGELSGTRGIDRGILLVITQPYVQGVEFVEELRDQGGWEAIDRAHENPPRSTAQTINPDRYPDDRPRNVSIPDRSSEPWTRFDHSPVGDTLGQASIFSMFAANDVIAVEDPNAYDHPVSNGWDGDRIVPYRNDRDGEFGYVWEIAWQTPDDARAFASAYRELLADRGGLERGEQRYRISEGPYAGAYRLTTDGDTVRIVYGPSVSDLPEIHGS